MPHNNGMDWIRLPLRFAIYYRDEFDCVWCRQVFPLDPLGYGLTLDHIDPEKGNDVSNLVTCCKTCNSIKQDMNLRQWYKYLVEQGHNLRHVQDRVRKTTKKDINLDVGKWLAAIRRPSYREGIFGLLAEAASA